MQMHRAEFDSVVLGACHQNTARHHRTLLHLPCLVDLGTEEAQENLFVMQRAYHQTQIAGLNGVLRGGYDYCPVRFLDAGHHVIARDKSVQFLHGKPRHHVVGHLEGDPGSLFGTFLASGDLFILFLQIYLKKLLDENHGEDDADHTERIGGGIPHRHLLTYIVTFRIYLKESLLGGSESGSVGHRTAHYADKL